MLPAWLTEARRGPPAARWLGPAGRHGEDYSCSRLLSPQPRSVPIEGALDIEAMLAVAIAFTP